MRSKIEMKPVGLDGAGTSAENISTLVYDNTFSGTSKQGGRSQTRQPPANNSNVIGLMIFVVHFNLPDRSSQKEDEIAGHFVTSIRRSGLDYGLSLKSRHDLG